MIDEALCRHRMNHEGARLCQVMDCFESVELIGDMLGASEIGHEVIAVTMLCRNLIKVEVQHHRTEFCRGVDAAVRPSRKLEKATRGPPLREHKQVLVTGRISGFELGQEVAQDTGFGLKKQLLCSDFRYRSLIGQMSPSVHIEQESDSGRIHILGSPPEVQVYWPQVGRKKQALGRLARSRFLPQPKHDLLAVLTIRSCIC